MKHRFLEFLIVLAAATLPAICQPAAVKMNFTVSMDQPNTHYYHVVFRCDDLKGETQDFKMPVWMPGYYRIMDYSKNVINFKATDGAGHPLEWAKTTKNTWHVKTANAPRILITYDVYAFTVFVAENYLDDQRGYIVGPGLYLHVAGMLNQPVIVTFKPYQGWNSLANGLDPVEGRPNTFYASDFDLLYDCPTLLGNQEHFQFDLKGVPHYIVAENIPAAVDRNRLAADLKKIVDGATSMIGEIPYRHYTFLLIGQGAGGVEHLTSAAMLFNPTDMNTPAGYRRFLDFAAHEYFHTFNIKRIRPIALGPFDYDHENFTTMLWVSEGFTSYYASLLVERAGLSTSEQYLDGLSRIISSYENTSGHLFQSAAESSMDTWIKASYVTRNENLSNTTISYYSKGPAIGAMLDLKIRAETGNKKSLDDVMRALYQEFFKQKKRGFTDAEFREVCERIAGVPLPEIFDDYVASTKDVNYAKYFAYAGLRIDDELRAQPGAYLGATMDNANNQAISLIQYDSPAQHAGLSAQDQILAIDGVPVGKNKIDELIRARKPGDRVKLLIAHRNTIREVDVELGAKMQKSFKLQPLQNPTPAQSAILKDWLKN